MAIRPLAKRLASLVAVAALAGCGGGGPSAEQGIVGDLHDHGVSSRLAQHTPPGILPPGATVYRVPGGELQVFRFDSDASARSATARVEPDGYTVTDKSGVKAIVDWVAPPHWFRAGREVVVYVGSSPDVLGALKELAGPQFAGA
jgi:hypothetical protein